MKTPLVSIRNIAISFLMPRGARVDALRDVSLDIQSGEFITIVGPSGSGKSTLLNIIGCLIRPTSGLYRLRGKKVSRYSRNELASIRNEMIGFVFQSYNLLEQESALYNVLLPTMYRRGRMAARRKTARAKLELVGLLHRINHLPGQLSGGEQQRVAIARALINNPALLLADEPTGNLDSESGEQIISIFERLNRDNNTTVIIATHNRNIAGRSHKILEVRDGIMKQS